MGGGCGIICTGFSVRCCGCIRSGLARGDGISLEDRVLIYIIVT